MSSFGTTTKTHHHQLRRQKTCFEVGSTNSSKLLQRDNTVASTTPSSKRGLCLQRQLSVDATSVIVNSSKFLSNTISTTSFDKNISISNSASDLSWKCSTNSINDRSGDHGTASPKTGHPLVKKRSSSQQGNAGAPIKSAEQEATERQKKALKERGSRLNLNIFLSHSTNSQDGDINGSDADSSNESITIVNKENTKMVQSDLIDEQSTCNTSSELNRSNSNCSSSSSNNNISSDNNNSDNTTNIVPIKKVPDTVTVPQMKSNSNRRPPLVRAMSAPIRPQNNTDGVLSIASSAIGAADASTKVIQVKRKLKKKKIVSRDARTTDDTLREEFDENDNELDDISNSSDSTTSNMVYASNTSVNSTGNGNGGGEVVKKPPKPTRKTILQRPRSAAVGNEVVTLVSLLSSGGSDSEKEDNNAPPANTVHQTKQDVIADLNARHRAPMLRKTGKSVSFQERDLPPEIPSSTKDFSKYRRGSVAPIAARIRSNRPPTAPAGSIYLCDIDINDDDFMKSIKNSNCSSISNSNYDIDIDNTKNNNASKNTIRNENKKIGSSTTSLDSKTDEIDEIEINYPDNVRTPKERECWKLYQKMLNRGVTVSYDTILRGMLTPTELRIIQKQNESCRIKNFDESNSGCGDVNTTTSSRPSTGDTTNNDDLNGNRNFCRLNEPANDND